MREISLTQGKVTIVDNIDFEWLNQYRWHFVFHKSGSGYATTSIKGKTTYMHRLINNTSEGFDTDHINGDRLDNRRDNLRTANRKQNNGNMKIPKHNTSGFKGVSFYKRDRKWSAQIHIQNKKKHLGYFSTAVGAARAYNDAAEKYFGKFARFNEVPR